jgi:ankyrin repeat protein
MRQVGSDGGTLHRLGKMFLSPEQPFFENSLGLFDEDGLPGCYGPSRGKPLYYMALYGCLLLASSLVDSRADVNAKGGWYGSALQVASAKGHHEVMQLLLNIGAHFNAPGDNALPSASGHGHLEVVRLLLDNGADVSAQG